MPKTREKTTVRVLYAAVGVLDPVTGEVTYRAGIDPEIFEASQNIGSYHVPHSPRVIEMRAEPAVKQPEGEDW